MTPELTETQQAAQDSIHNLVRDSISEIYLLRFVEIDTLKKDELLKDVRDKLVEIDTLRRNC